MSRRPSVRIRGILPKRLPGRNGLRRLQKRVPLELRPRIRRPKLDQILRERVPLLDDQLLLLFGGSPVRVVLRPADEQRVCGGYEPEF